jgi:hypothetical protein
LEIGVYKGLTLTCVFAEIKDSVDPDEKTPATYHITSDDFFERVAPTLPYKYNVVFIDGLHHSDQVNRDIANAIQYTEDDGIIILHDCNPESEMRQRVPADFDIWEHGWNGDVWKSIVWARQTYDYNIYVINEDEGLGVIDKRSKGTPLTIDIPDTLTYEFLSIHRKELLNLQ